MSEENAWAWIKAGDNRAEGDRLCRIYADETNDVLAAGTSVRTVEAPSGLVTVIVADGPWWQEQMRVHPNGWRGAPLRRILDRLPAESDAR